MVKSPKKRCNYGPDDLQNAVLAVMAKRMSDHVAAKEYNVPRRTIRNYVFKNTHVKQNCGRKLTLSSQEERHLSVRIRRMAAIGYPLTKTQLRLIVYKYCEDNQLEKQFNKKTKMASVKWVDRFMKRHPEIAVCKPQTLNLARAQKLNPIIVYDHFSKLKAIYDTQGFLMSPEKIFNMDEKGCRLCLYGGSKVLAETGSKRVPSIGNKHGENVTIVAAVNAIGHAVPPMILFKGERMQPEFVEDLPPGVICSMTPKGSMNIRTFVDWIQHLSKFKPPGPCLLMFDGAKCHIDLEVVDEADKHQIILYCLPSNTTHELQPLDKSVFRSYEHYWDEELIKYWQHHNDRVLTKKLFGKVFSAVWDKCMTMSNIKAGFRATGIYPYDPEAIPKEAFAPSTATELPNLEETGSPDPEGNGDPEEIGSLSSPKPCSS